MSLKHLFLYFYFKTFSIARGDLILASFDGSRHRCRTENTKKKGGNKDITVSTARDEILEKTEAEVCVYF